MALNITGIGVTIDSRLAVAGAKRVNTALDSMKNKSKRVVSSMKKGFSSLKDSLFSLKGIFATLGASVLGGMIVKIGSDFEQAMATVGGVMRATSEEMDALTAKAREMGATTEWSATQSAKALQFLGMAGFNSTQAIEALPGVLDLATAGNIQLSQAADIASNALTAMGLDASELGRINDVFVATITRSNTNIEQMAEAFKYAAPTAHAFGVETEMLSAMIGQLGNAGIQGSMAGTQLAFAMTKTEDVFKKLGMDGEGKSFVDALTAINAAGWDTNEILDVFGQRGGKAVLVMKDNTDALFDLQLANKNANGEAKTLAETMRDTVAGSFKEFYSIIQDKIITIFDRFTPMIRSSLDAMKEFISGLDAGRAADLLIGLVQRISLSLINIAEQFHITFKGIGDSIDWVIERFQVFGNAIALQELRAKGELSFWDAAAMGPKEAAEYLKEYAERKRLATRIDLMKKVNVQKEILQTPTLTPEARAAHESLLEKAKKELAQFDKTNQTASDGFDEARNVVRSWSNQVIASTRAANAALSEVADKEAAIVKKRKEDRDKAKAEWDARQKKIADEAKAAQVNAPYQFSEKQLDSIAASFEEIKNIDLSPHEAQIIELAKKYSDLEDAIPDIELAFGIDGDALQTELWEKYEKQVAAVNKQFQDRNAEVFFRAQLNGMSETERAVAQLNHSYEQQINELKAIGEAGGDMEKVKASIAILTAAQTDAVNQLKESQKEAADNKFWELQVAGMSEAEAKIANVKQTYQKYFDDLFELADKGDITMQEFDAAWKNLEVAEQSALNSLTDSYKRMESVADSFGDTMKDGFKQLLKDGEVSFKGLVESFAASLQDMAAEWAASELKKSLFGEIGGGKKGSTGLLGAGLNMLGGLFGFGGGRAGGGPVMKDMPYMVGESGRELFVPHSNGVIVSNNQLESAGKAITVNVNVPADKVNSVGRTAAQIGHKIGSQIQRSQRRNG